MTCYLKTQNLLEEVTKLWHFVTCIFYDSHFCVIIVQKSLQEIINLKSFWKVVIKKLFWSKLLYSSPNPSPINYLYRSRKKFEGYHRKWAMIIQDQEIWWEEPLPALDNKLTTSKITKEKGWWKLLIWLALIIFKACKAG